MECCIICGFDSLCQCMLQVIGSVYMWLSKEFFLVKCYEQQCCYVKYNDIEYNFEFNVKGFFGGLCDIQIIFWMVCCQFGSFNLYVLVCEGFLVESECSMLVFSQEFFWWVCYVLYMFVGCVEDCLLFDYQCSIVCLFGYEDNDVKLVVECFMQKYYWVVMVIFELNDLIIQYFEEVILFCEQLVQIQLLNSCFQLCDGYIEVMYLNVFKCILFVFLEIFVLMVQYLEIKGVCVDIICLLCDS